ncbi:MAG: hypothetical protein ACLQVD_15055 [Capsulimonadaceae bacterium]
MFNNRSQFGATCGAAGAFFLASVSVAFGDGTAMAPPIQPNPPAATAAPAPSADGTNSAANSVFNWSEVPQNQQVPINRACFDQRGYQLYDTVGETIVVPFTNNDLYVMKFAVSTTGSMYFVNEGDAPVLYVPQGGYLENATVPGARWYPFPHEFQPTTPVYVGIAPSWDLFIGMGWYPHMYYWGGYWCGTAYWAGGVFVPCGGLFIDIGGHPYYGWDAYHRYWAGHPGWTPVGWYNRGYYHWAAHPSLARPPFHGFPNHAAFGGGGIGGAHTFHGAIGGGGTFHGGGWDSFHGRNTFHGSFDGGGHTFHGGHSFGRNH